MRADAARNRVAVVDAATSLFAEQGLEVGVAEIARRAGVGTGTVFRRFATKQDLVVAVVEEKTAGICAIAEEVLEDDDAWAGFVRVMEAGAELQWHDRGFLDAAAMRYMHDERMVAARIRVSAAVGAVLERAQDAGVVRDDITSDDVPFLLTAAGRAVGVPAFTGQELWRRYLGIILDGLRPDAATPLTEPPPDNHEIDRRLAELSDG